VTDAVVDRPALTPSVLDALGPDEVLRLWEYVRRQRALQNVDPELREALLGRCALIAPELAATICAELEVAAPAAVLEAHWQEMIPNVAAIGAFRAARQSPKGQSLRGATAAWIREDPARLAQIVRRTAAATDNIRIVAEVAFEAAEEAGISSRDAKPVIVEALRALESKEHSRRGR